jgi:hypothetical protein
MLNNSTQATMFATTLSGVNNMDPTKKLPCPRTLGLIVVVAGRDRNSMGIEYQAVFVDGGD